MKTKNKMILMSFILFLSTCVITLLPTYAFPGQDWKTAIKWAEKIPSIGKLTKYESPETGQLIYSSKGSSGFTMVLDEDNNVFSEKIAFKGVTYTRTNTKAIDSVKNVYGASVSDDFKTAKFVSTFNPNYLGGKVEVYKGKKYAYFSFGDHLILHSIPEMNIAIDVYKNVAGQPQ